MTDPLVTAARDANIALALSRSNAGRHAEACAAWDAVIRVERIAAEDESRRVAEETERKIRDAPGMMQTSGERVS